MKALTVLAATMVAGSLVTLSAAEYKYPSATTLPGYAIIHFGPLLPSGDTSNVANRSLCFGLDVEFPSTRKLAFRSFTDYNFFVVQADIGTKLFQIGAGFALQLYLNDIKSFYFLAGPGLYMNRLDAGMDSDIGFSAGLKFGVGCNFSPNFGLEAKYITGDFPSTQVSLLWRIRVQ